MLAKTDKLDATILADYAAVMRPPIRPLAVGNLREIQDLVARGRQLVEMSTMEKNRLDVMRKALQADIRRHIKHLQTVLIRLAPKTPAQRTGCQVSATDIGRAK